MGLFGKIPAGVAGIASATPLQQQMEPPQNKKQGGFFAPDGWGTTILGAIGDYLAQQNDMAPMYQTALAARRSGLLAQAQADAENRQWYERERWKLDNRPKDPGSFEWYQGADPAARATYERYKQGDPSVTLTLPGNRVYAGPRSGLAAALGAGQNNPDATATSEDGYDYTPGPGGRANPANWKRSGGGASNGVGSFR